jgi:hypothetical protein
VAGDGHACGKEHSGRYSEPSPLVVSCSNRYIPVFAVCHCSSRYVIFAIPLHLALTGADSLGKFIPSQLEMEEEI